MPKISIIIPVYCVEKYIHRCIDSILAQTFTDFELILVDDGSPDNCGKICDEYAEKDDRIHVIHKENGGLSGARNAGIDWSFEHSNSEWITFIDSDDWIHPKYLEAMYIAVNETGCDISICAYEETEGKIPAVDNSKLIADVVDTESFFCEHNVNAVIACGKLYKKKLFQETRYPVGKLHEDEFTTYKLLFKYVTLAYINQPLYFYFQNADSITNSEWNPKRLDALEAYNEQLAFFEAEHYMKAYKKVLFCMAYKYFDTLKNISDNPAYVYYMRVLRKKLCTHLRKYKKKADFSIKTTPLLYECAYPLEMKFYWIIQSQVGKLKRKKNV